MGSWIAYKETPNYHPEFSELRNSKRLVLVDDDSNIHEKIHKMITNKKVLSFFSDYELNNFIQGNDSQDFFALIDYDLGAGSKTGLDLIKENNLKDKAILLTANYDEDKLIEKCYDLNIKIMPKNLLKFIFEV